MTSANTETLKFRPRARIIRTIGDRLISGPTAAVVELVKNAHDADAKSVTIKFVPPLTPGSGQIIVEDDGHGMTLKDVQNKWMEPATDYKLKSQQTNKGRKVLGSKGIGRFATARLGEFLTLETISHASKEFNQKTIVKNIDWNVFDTREYLDEVEFEVHTEKTKERPKTKLVITKLRDVWTQKNLTNLYVELRKMVLPLSEATGFEIYFDLSLCTHDTSGFNGSEIVKENTSENKDSKNAWKVTPLPIIDACDYEVKGSFNAQGDFEGSIEIKRGNLKSKPIFIEAPPLDEGLESPCGTFLVHFYIFDRDRSSIEAMAQRANRGTLSYKEARALLNEIAGVSIYRDNYRIRPYGDRENDWLGLDKQRVQNPTMSIGHDQVVGIIVIDDENRSGLVEKSSREGLEETAQYNRLKRLIGNLFRKEIGPERWRFRQRTTTEKKTNATFEKVRAMASLAWVDQLIAKLPEDDQRAAIELKGTETERLVRHLQTLEEKHAILEAKVTLGQIVAEVIHEGRNPVHFILEESARLLRWWPTLFDNSKETKENRSEMPSIIRGLYESADKLSSLFSSLQPLAAIRRGKSQKYDPAKVIFDTLKIFNSTLLEKGIDATVENKQNVDEIIGHKQDLQTAVSNLIDNSIYWLSYSKTKSPEIDITLKKNKKFLVITIRDNGPGIPKQYQDDIFSVGFTLKESGSGLGLAIARESLSRSEGVLDYIPSEDKGATFRIELPTGE